MPAFAAQDRFERRARRRNRAAGERPQNDGVVGLFDLRFLGDLAIRRVDEPRHQLVVLFLGFVLLLFEAMQQEAKGLHLGVLGSIIVAEVIFGALAMTRPDEQFTSLSELAGRHYATDVFADVPDIECMAQLAEFTAEIAGLQQAVPAFL